jgi:hypothetical protein
MGLVSGEEEKCHIERLSEQSADEHRKATCEISKAELVGHLSFMICAVYTGTPPFYTRTLPDRETQNPALQRSSQLAMQKGIQTKTFTSH